ncbi:hypothetical protein GCM10027063_00490 [Promicromonospora xylanilytica]
MTRSRHLDYSRLSGHVGLGDRLRTVGTSSLAVMGATLGVLLVVVPGIVLAALIATGSATDVGALVFLGMLLACGLWVVGSTLHKAGSDGAFGVFARANGLVLVRATAAPHYAGSQFADGSHIVHQSARTRTSSFVEVGDRFRIQAPVAVPSPLGVSVTRTNRPEMFLRARLAGPASREPHEGELITPELHERLTALAGPYTVEVSGDELTLFGSRPLETGTPGRVAEAFALAEELVACADAVLVTEPRPSGLGARYEEDVPDRPSPYWSPGQARKRRQRGPLWVVGLTLAFLVGVTLLIAITMSVIDDHLPGDQLAARLAVTVLVAATLWLAALLVRGMTTRQESEKDGATAARPRSGRLVLAAVAIVAVIAGAAWSMSRTDGEATSADPDADKSTAADCLADDPWCQWDVSLREWAAGQDLARVGDLDWNGCNVTGPEQATCPVRVECDEGVADLVAAFEGTPYEVAGVRAADSPPEQRLSVRPPAVRELVDRACAPPSAGPEG